MRNGIILALALLPLAVTACDAAPDGGERERTEPVAEQSAATEAEQPAAEEAVAADVVVYKSPTCSCCTRWIAHMRANGFDVEGVDLTPYAALTERKAELGVPDELGSCHTARVGGYTIEGHVPADVVARLLRENPADIAGLAVPGMPIGSPGMEGPNPERYQVIAFDSAGNRSVYAEVDPR